MKMTRRIYQSIVICLLLSSIGSRLSAQEMTTQEEVVVVMKSGTMFEGMVKEWTYGEAITITTVKGSEFTFPAEEIDRVVQKHLFNYSASTKKPYLFKETGRYYAIRMQYISGNEGGRARGEEGIGFSGVVGYRYNRFIGIGIGAGYDTYILGTGEKVLPVFLEASGYATATNNALYYNVALGYGLAFKDEEYNITAARGGLMAYPSIGVRFGAREMKCTLDLGYKFQQAEFTYANQWEPRSRREQRLVYKRLAVRFGILF